jgi:hypothetical protein
MLNALFKIDTMRYWYCTAIFKAEFDQLAKQVTPNIVPGIHRLDNRCIAGVEDEHRIGKAPGLIPIGHTLPLLKKTYPAHY